jgi:hypothetical protein
LDVIFEWGRKGPVTFVGEKLQWPLLYIPVLPMKYSTLFIHFLGIVTV